MEIILKRWSNIASTIAIILACIISSNANATHLVGGEVSYECIGGNNFQVTVKIYQDCIDGIPQVILDDEPLFFAVFENSPGHPLVRSGSADAVDTNIIPPEFSNDCISNYPNVCLREVIFRFDVSLDPSAYGYTIVNQRCCRNEVILNIVSPGSIGVSYFATVPPFESGECPNNSPTFNFTPPQIICASNPFSYDFSVSDIDGDSLVYKLCPSYIGGSIDNSKPSGFEITPPPFPMVPYSFGYSYDNPIPAFPPVLIDPEDGMMFFTPTASGRYQMNVCVEEYRDGVLLNTHSRDLQLLITDCSKNVIANTPLYSDLPNTYIVECSSYSVHFENTSEGGFSYQWDFGDGTPISTEFEPTHTYADTGTYEITLIVNPGSTCSDVIKRKVLVYPVFFADFTMEGIRCPGELISFFDTVYSSLNDPYTLQWTFGDGNGGLGSDPEHVFEVGGIYQVEMTATSDLGCKEVVTYPLDIRLFEPFAGNDTIIVLGYDFHLNASGGDQYEWFPKDYLSDGFIPNPKVTFPDTGLYTYSVKVSAEEGCDAFDTIRILVVKDPSIQVPSAFSPNGDGLNDDFKPVIIGYPFVEKFVVYNRYGELVHATYSRNIGWDGTYKGRVADLGVYFYELNVRNLQGETQTVKGDVTLVR